jgi:ABC-type oligopeptide transport system substrate-binding subunit
MRAILTAAALVSTALLATACNPKQDAAATNETAPVVDEGNVIDATNEATTNETAPADANSTGEEGNTTAGQKIVPDNGTQEQQSSGGVVLKK